MDRIGSASTTHRDIPFDEAGDGHFLSVLRQVRARQASAEVSAESVIGEAEQGLGRATIVVGGVVAGTGEATTPEGMGIPITAVGLGLMGVGAGLVADGQRHIDQGRAHPNTLPANPGLVPPAPTSHQPAPTPPATVPHASAPQTPAPVRHQTPSLTPPSTSIPHAVDSRRNDGLRDNPGLRTSGARARENACVADPGATQAIPAPDQRAHHIIPLDAIRKHRALFDAAARAGFRTDAPGNMAVCPANEAAREASQQQGVNRPVHDSGHPQHNRTVDQKLSGIEAELKRDGYQPGTREYDRRAAELVGGFRTSCGKNWSAPNG